MTQALLESGTFERSLAAPVPPPTLRLMDTISIPDELAPPTESSELLHARGLVETHPESAMAFARLSQALLAHGIVTEAVAMAEKSEILSRGEDPDASTAAAIVLLAAGQLGHAETILGRLSTSTGRFLFALCAVHRRAYDKALARLEGLDTYEARALLGWIRLQRLEYPLGIRALRSALAIGEPTPDVMINLAYAHAALGNRRNAMRAARGAVRLAPADPKASMNLAAARAGSRDFKGAIAELRRLESYRPKDLSIPIRMAMVQRQMGDLKGCAKKLRGLKSDARFWAASDVDRAELRMHLALLDLIQGKATRNATKAALGKALEESQFANLAIAQCLMSLYSRRTDMASAVELRNVLGKYHAARKLYWADCQIALLGFEFDEALTFARSWYEVDPFNASAASTVLYLLTDFDHNYNEAIRVGNEFLRRIDDRDMVLNNTVYAMVMEGRLTEAEELLSLASTSPVILATRGLIAIRKGALEDGKRFYDQAAKLATESGDFDLALLVRDRKALELDQAEAFSMFELGGLTEDPRYFLAHSGGASELPEGS